MAKPKVRRQPQRMCIGCRTVRAKRDLLRIGRTAEGAIQIDSSGRGPGRGAYICPNSACWEQALRGNKLEHALRATVTEEQRERLAQYATQLEGIS